MKKKDSKKYRSGAWRRHLLSVLVWFGAIACIVGLFYHRAQRFEVLGMAQGRFRQISAPVDGRLRIVSVELFEKVSKGQVLATLDDEQQLNEQIAMVSAEIERLMAELIATQDVLTAEAANRETDKAIAQRRFSVDVENARLRILGLKTVIETDRMMLHDLALEVKITKQLLDEQAIAPYEHQKAQGLYDALAKTIEENENLLARAEEDLKQTERRRDEFAQRQLVHPSVDSAIEVFHKAVTVQERMIDQFLTQLSKLVLKSPVDGVVVQIQAGGVNQAALRRIGEGILRKPGEFVLAGDPILVIAEERPRQVIAFIREDQLNLIREGTTVELIKSAEPAQIARSQVTYVGPAVEQMPPRLWRNPAIPQWGRPFLVKVPPQMKLIPGEQVGIRRLR